MGRLDQLSKFWKSIQIRIEQDIAIMRREGHLKHYKKMKTQSTVDAEIM